MQLLHETPWPLAGQPSMAKLTGHYWELLRSLIEYPGPTNEAEEDAFFEWQAGRNAHMRALGDAAEEQMCLDALGEMQAQCGVDFWATHPKERLAVDRHLDAIFLARIGVRFLLEHYIACDQMRPGFAGIIEERCSPAALAHTLREELKLADVAGGIRRSSLINVWSYRSLRSAWWRPEDGISLPLARLHCKYFGGSIALVPMEGFGTDCYITFNRLAHANSEQLIVVPSEEPTAEVMETCDVEALPSGLFDAQSRRVLQKAPKGRMVVHTI